MSLLRASACVFAVSVLVAPCLAAICPESCVCLNTRDGLHRATCSSLTALHKFTLRQKHYNINILDLSHNNITKLSHELDRLTEVVTLDLSTNGITELNKFLYNAKKLVHLNLANNRIRQLSLTHLPASVSSLDLTNNLLKDVPSDLEHLPGLEHLEMEGNPLDCSCENIKLRDRLLLAHVLIDKVQCISPEKFRGQSWLELKTKEVCNKGMKIAPNYLDMMMGDQPIDAERIGEESTALKSMSVIAKNVLDEGDIINTGSQKDDDDSLQFIRVSRSNAIAVSEIEGSGDVESTTYIADVIEPYQQQKLHANLMASEEIIPADEVHSTDDPIEGSGEGSGFGFEFFGEHEVSTETTTPLSEFSPQPVGRVFLDNIESNSSTEFPPVPIPNVFEGGGKDWPNSSESLPITDKPATPIITPDTTVSEKVTKELDRSSADTEKPPTPHKTATYVCVAMIAVLLAGLIGFAIVKGQIRKRRDRRLLRQQKRDVEKASKEMVDMNKSLLGKPAIAESPVEKKVNGKYELVPTHEPLQKKSENGDLSNGINHSDTNGLRTDSPRDTNQNKSSSKDNNLAEKTPSSIQDTSFESDPTSPESKKDTNSLSSEDIFVPMNDEEPRVNGMGDSELSQPLINGDQNTDSDFLSPSREYVPVYSPDMGRVRIKMAEIPKPKTPVLVTRSRSNAGDIIITPSLDENSRKSTT